MRYASRAVAFLVGLIAFTATRAADEAMRVPPPTVTATPATGPTTRPVASADQALIQGSWRVLSISENGAPGPDMTENPMSMRFEGDVASLIRGSRQKDSTFMLDGSKAPKQLTLTPKPPGDEAKLHPSIYELAGDHLKISFRHGDEGMTVPTGFQPAEGVVVMTLERDKAAAAGPSTRPSDAR